jgi:hypothetical protein
MSNFPVELPMGVPLDVSNVDRFNPYIFEYLCGVVILSDWVLRMYDKFSGYIWWYLI